MWFGGQYSQTHQLCGFMTPNSVLSFTVKSGCVRHSRVLLEPSPAATLASIAMTTQGSNEERTNKRPQATINLIRHLESDVSEAAASLLKF